MVLGGVDGNSGGASAASYRVDVRHSCGVDLRFMRLSTCFRELGSVSYFDRDDSADKESSSATNYF